MDLDADEYPPDWPIISYQTKEKAGWKCEECGAEEGTVSPTGKIVRVAAAHMGENRHLKRDCSDLKVLCHLCHSRSDAPYRKKAKAYQHEKWCYLRALELGCAGLWEEWRGLNPSGQPDWWQGIKNPLIHSFIDWARQRQDISQRICGVCTEPLFAWNRQQCSGCQKPFCKEHIVYAQNKIELCKECQDAIILAWSKQR